MAELLLRQGFRAKALAMYQRLVAARPDEPELARRAAEIAAAAAAERGGVMGFHAELQQIIDTVPGAVAGMLMGFDGIAIDTYEKSPGELDIATLLIEYSAAAEQARRAAATLGSPGGITEVCIAGEQLTALMRPLTQEIFLGVVLRSGGFTGQARYLMRIAGPKMLRELL